ncbi:glycosyltransferase family 2 protein [Bizionia sp. KMM 8389]
MLSILIPTYHYNVYPLAQELVTRAKKAQLTFELICIDDGSNSVENIENEKINTLENAVFIQSDKNNGRTLTRQLLAKKAKYDWLLFLDADVMPKNDVFFTQYKQLINGAYPIVFGGIDYRKTDYKPENALRFAFGTKREVASAEVRKKAPYKVICSANFMVKKSLFITLNSQHLKNAYGMDYIFGILLKSNAISVKHIDNEVYHLGINDNADFLSKIKQGLNTLKRLEQDPDKNTSQINLLKSYIRLKNLKLEKVFGQFMSLFEKPLKNHLIKSKSPNLFLFDLYRLGYFCRIKA